MYDLCSPITDHQYLTMQSRTAITGRHATVAARVGCHPSKISQYANGTYHIPSHRLFVIAAAQQDWTFPRLLAEQAGAVVIPHRPVLLPGSGVRLISLFLAGLGQFLPLVEQVDREEPLDDAAMLAFEDEAEKLKQFIDAQIAKARLQRALKNTEVASHENES